MSADAPLRPETSDIYARVVRVVAEALAISPSEIGPDSRFIEDLNASSLDIVTITLDLEDEFGDRIPEDDIEQLTTMNAAVSYIVGRMEVVRG